MPLTAVDPAALHRRLAGVRAVVIDLDGTLVDTVGDFDLALNAMLAALGLRPVDRDFIRRTVGKGSAHLLRSTLAAVGADAARLPEAMAVYQRHYQAVNGRAARLFPGTVEGLQGLAALGLPLACLTNKPGALARALLADKGLAGFFGPVFGGDDFARCKPDPLPLRETCRALGQPPAATLMVGDSANDAQAAHAAGCPVLLLRHGYNHGEPVEAAGADALLDRLDDLPPALAAARLSS